VSESHWCVYQHVFPDGKKYIGSTGVRAEKRWANGFGYVGQPKMFSAIIKFGWDKISHEIIKDELPRNDALALERILIENAGIDNLYNADAFSGGRDIIKNFDWLDCEVGEGIRFSRLLEDLPWQASDRIYDKYGGTPMYVHLHKDRVHTHIQYMYDDKHMVFADLEAYFPETGMTYRKLEEWLRNDADFVTSWYAVGDMDTGGWLYYSDKMPEQSVDEIINGSMAN